MSSITTGPPSGAMASRSTMPPCGVRTWRATGIHWSDRMSGARGDHVLERTLVGQPVLAHGLGGRSRRSRGRGGWAWAQAPAGRHATASTAGAAAGSSASWRRASRRRARVVSAAARAASSRSQRAMRASTLATMRCCSARAGEVGNGNAVHLCLVHLRLRCAGNKGFKVRRINEEFEVTEAFLGQTIEHMGMAVHPILSPRDKFDWRRAVDKIRSVFAN